MPCVSETEAEASLAAIREKLKSAVRKGRALEKERDRLQAELAERDAQQAAVRSIPPPLPCHAAECSMFPNMPAERRNAASSQSCNILSHTAMT